MIFTPHRILFGDEIKKAGNTEMHILFWWKNMAEKVYLKNLGVDEGIILKYSSNKQS